MRRPSVHPIIGLVTLVTITLITLLNAGEAQTKHYFDPPMLTVISIAYFTAALVMLVRTRWRVWTVLSSGLLATMLGDSLLYAYILGPGIGIEIPFQTVWLALIRSLLFIGGPFVLLGLAREELRVFRDSRVREETMVEQAAIRTEQAATEIRHTAEDLRQGVVTVDQDDRQDRQNEQQTILDETSLINTKRGKYLSEAGVVLDTRRLAMNDERHEMDDRTHAQDDRQIEQDERDKDGTP